MNHEEAKEGLDSEIGKVVVRLYVMSYLLQLERSLLQLYIFKYVHHFLPTALSFLSFPFRFSKSNFKP